MPPITTALPTSADISLTQQLELALNNFNLYETAEQSEKREHILGKLNLIVNDWVTQVSINKGLPEESAKESGARILTFGSYRLGVNSPGSDMDTLCLVPRHIDRKDFFDSLGSILKAHPEVTHFIAVPDAYVPVMKLYFENIQIDLLCSILSVPTIPEDINILDPRNLQHIDDQSVRSLNGCRVADQIIQLVPSVDNFRTALICIKKWAKARGIYSNVMGFFGGISWALLTAFVCQLYPNAAPSTLVSRFFRIYTNWKWPTPVLLTSIEEGGPFSHKVWNPRTNFRDREHLMPIITPAYPSMNSTYNVSESTKKIILKEFQRGLEITSAFEKKEKRWEDLFEEFKFWETFQFYIRIDCMARSEPEYRKWVGFVESKVRLLILKLEKTPFVECVHPHPEGITYTHLQFPHASAFFLGVQLGSSTARTNGTKVDLTPAVIDFLKQVKDWKERTVDMEITVNSIKESQLPDFVFAEGKRPEKKRKRNGTTMDRPAKVPKRSPEGPSHGSSGSSFSESEVWPPTPLATPVLSPRPSSPTPQKVDTPTETSSSPIPLTLASTPQTPTPPSTPSTPPESSTPQPSPSSPPSPKTTKGPTLGMPIETSTSVSNEGHNDILSNNSPTSAGLFNTTKVTSQIAACLDNENNMDPQKSPPNKLNGLGVAGRSLGAGVMKVTERRYQGRRVGPAEMLNNQQNRMRSANMHNI
uniref:polynucleotide adenylyltransferase n=1 Tax=Arcella intermedia TaxID=1963864 RepID=A0A6B2KYP3_9EUKA